MIEPRFPRRPKVYADARSESSVGERFYVDRGRLSRHLTIERTGCVYRTATAAGFVATDDGMRTDVAGNPFARFARDCYEKEPPAPPPAGAAPERAGVPTALKEFCLAAPPETGFRFTWEARRIAFANTLGRRAARDEATRVVRMDHAVAMGERTLALRRFAYGPDVAALASALDAFAETRRALGGIRPVRAAQAARVVLHPSLAAVWIHEVVGHWIENVSQSHRAAALLGKRVAPPGIHLADRASDPTAPFAFACDDEGIACRDVNLIEDGIFAEPYLSVERAFFSGVRALNGRARAQDFKFMPVPRMMNILLLPGEASRDDLIAAIDEGYYLVGSLGGLRGPNLFQVQSQFGYRIEKGRLTHPVFGPLLMGVHAHTLENIVGVSREFSWVEDGGCLSEGQFLDQSGRGAPYLSLQGVQIY